MRVPRVGAAALALLVGCLAWASPSPSRADVPARVRLLVPTCADDLDWADLARALEVELRTLGSSVAVGADADMQLLVDVPCGEPSTEAVVTLVHVPSGRNRRDVVPLGQAGEPRAQELALALAELVRLRSGELARDPPPPAPPVVDVGAFANQITAAVAAAVPVPEPEPPPEPPVGELLDLAFGVNAYPASDNASAELRAGYSFATDPFRLAIDVIASFGWAGDVVGDVALGGLGLGLGLRGAHRGDGWSIASGLRVDLGWVRATGITDDPGVVGAAIDALHIAAALDARLRLRVGTLAWFVLIPEIGAALVGIEVLAGTRRVTAQLGPRLGLSLGLSFGL